MAINLQVEEYCQNCPDFEPNVQRQSDRKLYVDNNLVGPLGFAEPEVKYICETTVECKYKKRCAAQMRYLQRQHDAMKKKETGDTHIVDIKDIIATRDINRKLGFDGVGCECGLTLYFPERKNHGEYLVTCPECGRQMTYIK